MSSVGREYLKLSKVPSSCDAARDAKISYIIKILFWFKIYPILKNYALSTILERRIGILYS